MAKVLSIDETVREVLAQANAEQNQHWPPHVISAQYNLVTDALIDQGVKVMGENNFVKALMRPFNIKKQIVVKNGSFELPEDFRNFSGMGIYVKGEGTVCDERINKDQEPTDEEMQEIINKAQVECTDLPLVEIDEWNDLTKHSYKKPTLEKPIACLMESNLVRVSPFNIQAVELRFVRKPKIYVYGYGMNTDDSYYYDPTMKGAVESEWLTNARAELFKGMNKLYAVFARDGNMQGAAAELSKVGFF